MSGLGSLASTMARYFCLTPELSCKAAALELCRRFGTVRGFVSFNDSLASRRTGASREGAPLERQRRTAGGREDSHARAGRIGSGFERNAYVDCVLRSPMQELVAAHLILR
jgi:hypothetical protein